VEEGDFLAQALRKLWEEQEEGDAAKIEGGEVEDFLAQTLLKFWEEEK
jgi:hypothetical protein